MNKGNTMIKDIMKLIASSKDTSDNGQTSCYSISDSEKRPEGKEGKNNQAIKLLKKERNMANRIFRLYPHLAQSNVFKLFGFMSINERALQDSAHQQSFFKSHFHGRVVERVEVYENAVLVELAAPQMSADYFGIAQIIENYKRKGCMKFYELALQIEQVVELFKVMQGVETIAQKPQSLKKWLDTLGNSMFVCTSGVRKVVISRSLLAYLEYDVEEFCVQAIKFRGVFVELFSANCYYSGIMHLLSLFKCTIQLANGQITPSQFKQLTTFRFSDFIYSKSNIRSYCDMSLSLLNPSFLCHKINYIYYKQKESSKLGTMKAIQAEKERVRQAEYQTIRKVKNIPSSLLTQNQQLISGYKVVRQQTEQDEKLKQISSQ